ncbi:hypothetical protein CORC01_11620 [Colletotrichum orchidophilum]|uniref:Methyltransferase n=1 Tax=Colletotrichum orchidophilum TaxID=1209926 RepID=A0A1G4AVH4_9PEZI|nr:uncharacterized protein CORC01_11620 [Colletotrichum orchidophilum]OHE93063.1 hypothetical protein CORC01_11620 [Colletotrichum orchidophilum]
MALPSPVRLTAYMYFLARDPKYEHEKPYTLRYVPSPLDGIPQSNIDRVQHEVKVHDLRLRSLDYDECGFTVANCPSALQYDDYADTDKIEKIHALEVIGAVRLALAATSVDLLDYVVRRRHPSWPIATGGSYAFNQPASRAHIDHTYEGGRALIRETFGEKAESILGGRWQCVNVWHPLRGPLVDWPLAMCDAQTVDFARDTMAGDVVDRDHVFENTQIHFNARQTWFFLSNQLPTELIIFKNADSQEPMGATPGVPHASFDNPTTQKEDFRRESIEMRILVRWK